MKPRNAVQVTPSDDTVYDGGLSVTAIGAGTLAVEPSGGQAVIEFEVTETFEVPFLCRRVMAATDVPQVIGSFV